jgi:hypothetical protein
MALLNSPASRLHSALVAAGHTYVVGVRIDAGPTIVLDFSGTQTPEQEAAAQSFAAGFDLRPHRPRTLAAITTDLQALSAANRDRVLLLIAAHFIRQAPAEVRRRLGLPIDGTEPDV